MFFLFLCFSFINSISLSCNISLGSIKVIETSENLFVVSCNDSPDFEIKNVDELIIEGSSAENDVFLNVNQFINIDVTNSNIGNLVITTDSLIEIYALNSVFNGKFEINSTESIITLVSENSDFKKGILSEGELRIYNATLLSSEDTIKAKNLDVRDSQLSLQTKNESMYATENLEIKNCIIDALSLESTAIGVNDKDLHINFLISNSTITAESKNGGCAVGSWGATFSVYDSIIQARNYDKYAAVGGSSDITIVNSNIKTQFDYGGGVTSAGTNFLETPGPLVMYLENSFIEAMCNPDISSHFAGVGGGYIERVTSIEVLNCTINTTSTYYGAGLGSGYYSRVELINIKNSKVFSKVFLATLGTSGGAGIGGSYYGSSDVINIYDSFINSSGSDFGAGIGSGYMWDLKELLIERSTVYAYSGLRSAAIGTASQSTAKANVTLKDSYIYAFSGAYTPNSASNGAAIGTGSSGLAYKGHDSGNVTIINCNVTAISGYSSSGAGIGGGSNVGCGNINILDSNVLAIASLDSQVSFSTNGGAGIGSGGTTFGKGTLHSLGSIYIARSNVSTFGANIKFSGQSGITCGPGIGIGGSSIESGYPEESMNITIENSNIYSYGGNSTCKSGHGGVAIGGNDFHLVGCSPTIIIKNSYIYSVAGSTSYNETRGTLGNNFDYKDPSIQDYNPSNSGELSLYNSKLFIKSNDLNATDIIVNKLYYDQNVEIHSSNENLMIVNEVQGYPTLIISNLNYKEISNFTLFDNETNNQVLSVNLNEADYSLTLSLDKTGIYYMKSNDFYISADNQIFFKINDGINMVKNIIIASDTPTVETTKIDPIVSSTISPPTTASTSSDPAVGTSAITTPDTSDNDYENNTNKTNIYIISGVCGGIALIIIIVVAVIFIRRWLQKRMTQHEILENTGEVLNPSENL